MYNKTKIKELENGLQRDVMMFILHQVKNTKGLTNLLKSKGGMNAKWTNPKKVYNLQANQFFKIVILKVSRQSITQLIYIVILKVFRQSITQLIYDLIVFALWLKIHLILHPEMVDYLKESCNLDEQYKTDQDLEDFKQYLLHELNQH